MAWRLSYVRNLRQSGVCDRAVRVLSSNIDDGLRSAKFCRSLTFAGIAGMAVQNAVQRVHFASMPPTTLMTGNTTQTVLDAVDLVWGLERVDTAAIPARFARTLRGIVWFFWCLVVPVAIGATTAILRES
jgi:hypothetical protein